MQFPKGSEWRRWDLHLHTLGTAKADEFSSNSFDEFCVTLFKRALAEDIAAIGITDYFSIDNFRKVQDFVAKIDEVNEYGKEEREKIKSIFLFPNVELRMKPSTGSGRLVNIHCLFDPTKIDKLDNNFFGKITFEAGSGEEFPMNHQGLRDYGRSIAPDLDDDAAYSRGVSEFVVSHEKLEELKRTNKEFWENVIIIVSNSRRDGASGLRQKHYDHFEGKGISSLDGVRRAIYRVSDAIFSSNPRDAEYFVGEGADDAETVKKKCRSLKPCFHGSDAHKEEDLFKPDDDRYCWIKADLTFDGLRQVLYEPFPGERVWIGPTKPFQKRGYKVIKSIEFDSKKVFPQKIEFNQNLCSIIGSRSSGKSALLAYLADGIDTSQARDKMPDGPADGIRWEDVDFSYHIKWANDKLNTETEGKILYLPQNFLYELSKNPEKIAARIKPVLFRELPEVGKAITQYERKLEQLNEKILMQVKRWFDNRKKNDEIAADMKELGSKKALENDVSKLNEDIDEIEKKHKLDSAEVKKYQKLMKQISDKRSRVDQIDDDIEKIGFYSDEDDDAYIDLVAIAYTPPIDDLPEKLREQIERDATRQEKKLLDSANTKIRKFLDSLISEKTNLNDELEKLPIENIGLITSYEKNQELDEKIKVRDEQTKTLSAIIELEKRKLKSTEKLTEIAADIAEALTTRSQELDHVLSVVSEADQSAIQDMTFGIESKITEERLAVINQMVNSRETTDFVIGREIQMDNLRSASEKFLEHIYKGKQRLTKDSEPISTAQAALTLTEDLLMTAQMEGDTIGGFSEPTMTPGKRALFALRLIMAESEDTWPLLVDQPEDDLDSRSIYDEIVPFLKDKKKERQIIMVSHNANFVVGADSEQILVANRHGEDRKNTDGVYFNYLTGSLEHNKKKDGKLKDTLKAQGIREHTCLVLEGGEDAFEQRRNRYALVQE